MCPGLEYRALKKMAGGKAVAKNANITTEMLDVSGEFELRGVE